MLFTLVHLVAATNSRCIPFQISKNDTLPQQVCVNCAKTAISACLFKKKCEDADNFYRQQLLIKKIEEGHSGSGSGSGNELKPEDATVTAKGEGADEAQVKRRSSASAASSSSSGSGSGSSSSGSGSSSSSSDDDDDEDHETNPNLNPNPNHSANANGNGQVEEHVTRAQNGHGQLNGSLAEHEQHEAEKDNEDAMEQQQQQHKQQQQLDEEAALEQRLEQQQQQHQQHQQQERHEDGEMPEHLAFNSIRLMQEYMQQRMNKFPNGGTRGSTGHLPDAIQHDLEHELYEQQQRDHEHDGDDDDEDDDEEMSLPLIPEIELITPSDDPSGMLAGGGNDTDGGHGLPNGVGSITGAGVGSGVGVGGGGGAGAAAAVLHGGVGGGGMRGFQCPHCFLIFEMKQILKAHMQSVHGAPGPVYECTNCRKTYFYKRFLEKHIRRGRCVKKRRNQT